MLGLPFFRRQPRFNPVIPTVIGIFLVISMTLAMYVLLWPSSSAPASAPTPSAQPLPATTSATLETVTIATEGGTVTDLGFPASESAVLGVTDQPCQLVADLNQDCEVDLRDYTIFVRNFKKEFSGT